MSDPARRSDALAEGEVAPDESRVEVEVEPEKNTQEQWLLAFEI